MSADLGALLRRLLDEVVERETPILRERGLSMWEYVVLTAISSSPGLSQSDLAERSRRDATRLIRHLDDLAERGLIVRAIDASDRRRRTVELSPAGGELLDATRHDIRRMENELLSALPERDRDALRTSLATVTRAE